MATSSRRQTRLGFTLVELLVVIAIIGMLVALLLPAVNAARKAGRQAQCLNTIKNLSLAMVAYDSSRGQLPGFSQLIKRDPTNYANLDYDSSLRKVTVITTPTSQLQNVKGFSWLAVLLPRLERADLWDAIVNPPDKAIPVPLPVIGDIAVCPEDSDVKSQPDVPALSYSVNTGAWDRDNSKNFLFPTTSKPNQGDTADNGIFFSYADYDRAGVSGPKMRISAIKDGAGTTIMMAENIHKSYESTTSNGSPAFGWMSGNEQQLGVVWVVPTNGTSAPQPGNTINDQERLNGNDSQLVTFDPTIPRFARPASGHSGGFNVAFCDGHSKFQRDDIDYTVYQQLMTPNGRKCVDPTNTTNFNSGTPIYGFRTLAPLAEKDFE
jgi:prepilin-type N-terminal cleavage/methylation domain-containing protein/prepilin-type processing-associated H-X9-DG protein